MFKKLRVLLFVSLMLGAFAGTAYAYEVKFKDLAIYVDGELTRSRTTAVTIGEALKEKDIPVYENDEISKSLDEEFISGAEVRIKRGFNVVVVINGKGKTFTVKNGAKAGEVISKIIAPQGIEYIYSGSYAKDLEKDETIILDTKRVENITTYESLPFGEQQVEDPELEEGNTKVVNEGIEGKKEIVTEVIYINDIENTRRVISENVVEEPVDKVIAIGTKPKQVVETNEGEFKYKKVMTMTATAYTNSIWDTGKAPGDPGYGITATGMHARVGVVAVDPSVIPLYTNLYVEGYGYCVAGDTGVFGNKIDLFFDTRDECFQFGRRPITVYILD